MQNVIMVHCYKRNAFFAKHNALPPRPVQGMHDVIAKEQLEGLSLSAAVSLVLFSPTPR